MSEIHVQPTDIEGLCVLSRKLIGDSRGYLERMFCSEVLSDILGDRQIVQINHTLTALEGAVRGMHFQYPPHAETKIVSCLRGAVFDVAVDLRPDSPTFLKWHGEILSADNHKTLYIPEGFAHGFQTLAADCELLYLHTAPYAAAAEGALNATDPSLAIAWPKPISQRSPRDEGHPVIDETFRGITL